MGYKEREGYDDMRTSGSRGRDHDRMDPRSRRIIIFVILAGVLLCIVVAALWLFSFSTPTDKTTTYVIESAAEPILQAPPVAPEEVVMPPVEPVVPVAQPKEEQKGSWYVEHSVKEGETLDSIAQSYGISIESIISVNGIKNLASVKPGVVLRIPTTDGQLYTVQEGDSLSIITNRFNPGLGWKTLQEINGLESEVIYPGQKLFIPSPHVAEDLSFAGYDRFIKPAQGRITGLYGQPVKYAHTQEIVILKGIWIEGESGSDIVASSAGVVVDVGNEPEGRGKFVVLSHEQGYRTIYAHLEEVLVKVGDKVEQRDVIGTMGSTGAIGKTALYFAIEQEGIALDPATFF